MLLWLPQTKEECYIFITIGSYDYLFDGMCSSNITEKREERIVLKFSENITNKAKNVKFDPWG